VNFLSKKTTRINNINKPEYKVEDICAGFKCINKPITVLKIRYLNKIGGFCNQHKEDLLQLELAEEILKVGIE
jgi:hypothetical protein